MTGERYHAADDGSEPRPASGGGGGGRGGAARGAILIGLAVVLGLVLLAVALDDPADVVAGPDTSTDEPDTTTTTAPPDGAPDETPPVDPDDSTVPTISTSAAPVSGTNPPAEVTILVANGKGESGVAGAVSNKITARSYLTLEAANAPPTDISVIYYRDGYDGDAREIATIVGAPPDVITNWPADGTIGIASNAIEDGRLESAHIVVIVGGDDRIPTG